MTSYQFTYSVAVLRHNLTKMLHFGIYTCFFTFIVLLINLESSFCWRSAAICSMYCIFLS